MMFSDKKILVIVPTIFLGLLLTTPALSTGHQTKAQPPNVPVQLNMNKLLYGNFCSSCHGVDLRGTEKGPPFLHRFYLPGHHSDTAFFRAAKNGTRAHHWNFGDMKPVKGTNNGIVASIVQYVRYVQKQAGLF